MTDNANAGAPASVSLGFKPWLLVAPILIVAVVFISTSIVVTAGMLPTIVARVVDTSPGKRLTITVGAMNLVGCLYFINLISSMAGGISDAPVVLSNSFGWLCALVGAGMGWIIFGAMPVIVGQLARTQTAIRTRRVTGDQDRLVKEWGESVRGVYGVKAMVEAAEENAE